MSLDQRLGPALFAAAPIGLSRRLAGPLQPNLAALLWWKPLDLRPTRRHHVPSPLLAELVDGRGDLLAVPRPAGDICIAIVVRHRIRHLFGFESFGFWV